MKKALFRTFGLALLFAPMLAMAASMVPFNPAIHTVVASGGGSGFPSGSAAYWLLGDDNVWADSVGSESLTEVGTVTTAAGQQGNDASFPAGNTTSYLKRADDNVISTGNIDFTLLGGTTPHISSGIMPIIEKGWDTYLEYEVFVDYTSDKFKAYMKDLAVTVDTAGSGFPDTGGGFLIQDTPYFYICWYDSVAGTFNIRGGTTTALGSVVTTSGVVGGNTSTTGEFRIGWRSGPTFADGLIGDQALFKRVLTLTEQTNAWTAWKTGVSGP
jgi:hypothetical protein